MGNLVSFNRADGSSLEGYLAEPAEGGPSSAIVVIQEWWGLNDQIRGVADRLATAGYLALVPDLFRGKSTVEAEEAQKQSKACTKEGKKAVTVLIFPGQDAVNLAVSSGRAETCVPTRQV